MTKKQRSLPVEPSLGDYLLIHVPFDKWFLRKFYLGEDGGRHARLIDEDMNRDRLYILGLAEAKSEKGRLLQLVKSEIKANKEVNTWEVLA